MSEEEIATCKVIPFLENLGWSKQLITEYGRVPVQMGTEVKYADIVALFVDDNNITFPYLVVEVKTSLDNLERTKAQVNSYAKQLDAQIFVVTDGESYRVYQRSQWGGYIEIKNIPVPEKQHLTVTEKTNFKMAYVMCADSPTSFAKPAVWGMELEKEIDAFFRLISENSYYRGRNDYSLRQDITGHYRSVKAIHSLIHDCDIDSLKPDIFKNIFSYNFMCKLPNQNKIFFEADNNFTKVQLFLKFIRDFEGSPEENLDRLFDTADKLHINGAGPFIISQFLAGAHPREYAIIEENMINTMKNLKLIDVKVSSDTPNGYLYINEVCKKLLTYIFKRKIDENKDKLGFRVDDDFGLVVMHEFFWEYSGFYRYDKSKLEELAGEQKEVEEIGTNNNLQEINMYME